MKAFILCAGIGKRLQPLSNEIPAPMLPLLNKPLIIYILEHLKKFNIQNIKINLFHLPEYIDSYLGDGEKFDLNFSYSLEKDLVGTAGAIKRNSSFVNETLYIQYGNTILDINISDFYFFHKQKKSILTYAVIKNHNKENAYEITFNKNSRIVDYHFRGKPSSNHYVPAGAFLIEPEILNYIPRNIKFDFEEELLFEVCKKQLKSYAYIVNGDYYSIVYPKDLLEINLNLLNKLSKAENKLIFYLANSKIDRSIIQNVNFPIFIGSNSEIKMDVKIAGPVVIGDNVTIDSGTHLSNSIVLNNTYIGKELDIKDSIIFKNLLINTTKDFGIYIIDNFILSTRKKVTFRDRLGKISSRITDIVLSIIGITLLLPVFIIIAILIKIESKGPIFFKSKRIKSPTLVQESERWYRYEPEQYVYYLKFRTMRVDAPENEKLLEMNIYDEGPFFKAKEDPRITRIGKFLRRYSLDELPLLFNVLMGDISLVGIWGLPPKEAEQITKVTQKQKHINISETALTRFRGKLGLAGYWQSRGRSDLTAEERIIHDAVQAISDIEDEQIKKSLKEYSDTHSPKGYISLILDTIKSVIKKQGAY